jgi:hypothetical protein
VGLASKSPLTDEFRGRLRSCTKIRFDDYLMKAHAMLEERKETTHNAAKARWAKRRRQEKSS